MFSFFIFCTFLCCICIGSDKRIFSLFFGIFYWVINSIPKLSLFLFCEVWWRFDWDRSIWRKLTDKRINKQTKRQKNKQLPNLYKDSCVFLKPMMKLKSLWSEWSKRIKMVLAVYSSNLILFHNLNQSLLWNMTNKKRSTWNSKSTSNNTRNMKNTKK